MLRVDHAHKIDECLLVAFCVVEFQWCTDGGHCSDFISWWVVSRTHCTAV